MNLNRLKKTSLPISWYLALFMVVAIVPAGISAYLSVQQGRGHSAPGGGANDKTCPRGPAAASWDIWAWR